MVEKLRSQVIENIAIKFAFTKEHFAAIYKNYASFSNKIELRSNGYLYDSWEDLQNNIGLFDLSDWELSNFGSNGNNTVTVAFNGKELEMYFSDINSPIQQNFQGKIKALINEEAHPKRNEVQLIREITVEGQVRGGKLSFFKQNKHTIRTAIIAVLAGVAATVVGGLILRHFFSI